MAPALKAMLLMSAAVMDTNDILTRIKDLSSQLLASNQAQSDELACLCHVYYYKVLTDNGDPVKVDIMIKKIEEEQSSVFTKVSLN